MLFRPRPVCPERKSRMFRPLNNASLGQCVPWMTRPWDDASRGRHFHCMDDASLGQCLPGVLALWDWPTECWDRLGKTVEVQPGIQSITLMYNCVTTSISMQTRVGTRRPRDAPCKGRIIQGTRRPKNVLSKGRNIRDFSFRHTSLRDTLSRHHNNYCS
jgi:hypothetical protein